MRHAAALARCCAVLLLAATASACIARADDPPTPRPNQYDERITVTMDGFRFNPRAMQFAKGQTIALDLAAVDDHHTFNVAELGIQWKVRKGRTLPVLYKFTSSGIFRLNCSIEGHADSGMIGLITVR